ncbi:hypothetical protein Tco_1209797 [Tanacetum coccineum]
MEAHIALMQPIQVYKITSSCEIYGGPHDTQCCMEDPEQAFIDYASSCNNEEDEAKEEGSVKSNITKGKGHEMSVEAEEEVESEEESEEETEEETEKEKKDNPEPFDTFPTMKELSYHEWLLKTPRPPRVKAKIRTGNLNNVGSKEETVKLLIPLQ